MSGSTRVFAVVAVVFCLAAVGVVAQPSKEQVSRGEHVYDTKCSECHDGGIMGPELRGGRFVDDWKGKPLPELYELVSQTMPADNPGTLSESDSLDVVVYLLHANHALPSRSIDTPKALDSLTFTSEH